MLNKDQSQKYSSSSDPKAVTEVPLVDPDKTIEGSGGSGTVDDPSATDKKPSGIADLELLV